MRIRRLLLFSLLNVLLLGTSGCLDFIYAQGEYNARRRGILNSHADVTVSGRVVDEAGKPLTHRQGIVSIVGVRHKARLGMEGEGSGDLSELISNANWFDDHFKMHVDYVCEATLLFWLDGYEPASFRVVVPPGKEASPVKDSPPDPVVVNDAVVVMRRANAGR